MKYRNVTERVGELLGPIDWDYDFLAHFNSWGLKDEWKKSQCQIHMDWLRAIEAEPDQYEATTDGGSPKFGWHDVVAIGMYDGWPYWRPVPSVALAGPLGVEWQSFCNLTAVSRK